MTERKKLIGAYRNGSYFVSVLSDGTKIRKTEEDEFIPSFSENCDVKITNKCSGANCAFCHEGSGPDGKHGDIMNAKFLDTLHPFTEIAIGGGNPLSHPLLIPFLHKLQKKRVFANITVNQRHFMDTNYQHLIRALVDRKLVYGVGVSLTDPSDEFIETVKQYPNAVIHVINGVHTAEQFEKLKEHDLKILILGYKELRRGAELYSTQADIIEIRKSWLYENLRDLLPHFEVVSFDNLAIKQLNAKRLMSEEKWDEFYMGDDGSSTFYIDLVEQKFAKSSTAPFDKRYDLLDNIDDMFEKIRKEK